MLTRKGAVFALASLMAAGALHAATSYQVAYVTTTSGPAAGGTVVAIYGNQFVGGATVTVGGAAASAGVTSSTRISATMPARGAGYLYDIAVDNPGTGVGVIPAGWFADFLDVPQASPFHTPVETIVRDGITSGCGGGNFCPSSSITRAQMAVFLLRAGHGSGYVPPPASGTLFSRRRRLRLRGRLDRGALRRGHHRRLRDGPPALLPEQPDHARPDGRLPPQGLPRHQLRARRRRRASSATSPRRCRSRPGSRSSRACRSPRAAAARPTARPTPSRAARWPCS